MDGLLAGISIAVIGGDDRELVLISELVKQGAFVKVVGFPPKPELKSARIVSNIKMALEGVDVVVLPMPGTDANGVVRAVYATDQLIITEDDLGLLKPGTLLIVGVARQILKDMARRCNIKIIETANLDNIAILNSIPTAEGAIQIAMEELPITIHGSRALVLGFGRCGITLARSLKALGAEVYIAARRLSDLARGYEAGYKSISYSELNQFLSEFDVIFNTVPFLILDRSKISLLNHNCLIIDIAATPGGTDFQAAEEAGIKAILAPGLPGKVAFQFILI